MELTFVPNVRLKKEFVDALATPARDNGAVKSIPGLVSLLVKRFQTNFPVLPKVSGPLMVSELVPDGARVPPVTNTPPAAFRVPLPPSVLLVLTMIWVASTIPPFCTVRVPFPWTPTVTEPPLVNVPPSTITLLLVEVGLSPIVVLFVTDTVPPLVIISLAVPYHPTRFVVRFRLDPVTITVLSPLVA